VQIFQTVDDLDYAEGKKVAADRTHRLTLDRRDVELDLTAAHYDQLAALLAPYLDAGRPPQDGGRPATAPARGRNVSRQGGGMRAYADAHGINYRTQHSRKPYYPQSLRAAYAALTDEERAEWEAKYHG
jgi:hypothetical protein